MGKASEALPPFRTDLVRRAPEPSPKRQVDRGLPLFKTPRSKLHVSFSLEPLSGLLRAGTDKRSCMRGLQGGWLGPGASSAEDRSTTR